MHFITWVKPRPKRDALQHLYVNCTKLDVAMNGMLTRAKFLVCMLTQLCPGPTPSPQFFSASGG